LFEATYSGVLDKREVIHRILETHGLDPAETAFVGDMTHDVETARHGGVSSIAVLTGYNHPEILAQVRPDLTVPDLGVLRECSTAAIAPPAARSPRSARSFMTMPAGPDDPHPQVERPLGHSRRKNPARRIRHRRPAPRSARGNRA
jgi:hypothetical protein